MTSIASFSRRPDVLRVATAVMIAAWLAGAVIALVHDPSGNHSVEGLAEHLQLAVLTITTVTLVPIVLRLGALAGAPRAAAVALVGANAVGALCVVSNVNSGDPSFFTVVAVPSMLSWLAGFVALAVALGRSGALPKAYAVALPVTWLLGTMGAQASLGVVTAAFWLLVALRLGVFAAPGAVRGGRTEPQAA
jgi:hypothetical protein